VNSEDIDTNLNTLFKLVHITSFNVSLQALALLNQVVDSRDDILHRYFNALYRKMLALEWRNTAKETFFLNLLFNSIKRDDALPRIKAFVKRLLQICFAQHVPFVCGSFMLVSELLKSKKSIFQVDHAALLAAGNSIENGSVNDADKAKKMSKFKEDDEEERFVDVKSQSDDEEKDEDENEDKSKTVSKKKNNKEDNSTSWLHKKNIIFKRHEKYDINERNPLYCGADKTLTYELLPFTRHYHPTVVVFANQLLNVTHLEILADNG
jgi:ribosome biogenesis protein MAK21